MDPEFLAVGSTKDEAGTFSSVSSDRGDGEFLESEGARQDRSCSSYNETRPFHYYKIHSSMTKIHN